VSSAEFCDNNRAMSERFLATHRVTVIGFSLLTRSVNRYDVVSEYMQWSVASAATALDDDHDDADNNDDDATTTTMATYA